MSILKREFLTAFGWKPFYEQQLDLSELEQFVPARVIGEERGSYRVQWNFKEIKIAVLSGKFRHTASGVDSKPAVGDWVLCRSVDGQWPIERVLERQSLLRRKGPDGGTQLIAANVDQVFVSTALNQDFNLNRIARYLVQIEDSGARPIILLTKSDLHTDTAAVIESIKKRFPHTEIVLTSLHKESGLQSLIDLITPGSTSVLVGSSGVGKSSLLNFLIGEKVVETQAIRDDDGKGRHTTTARYLFSTKTGGMVIDTPGMREFGLDVGDLNTAQVSSGIDALVLECKFTDCSHGKEPGCAIQGALLSGTLDKGHWENYLKLQKEIEFNARKNDKALQSAQKDKWKNVHAGMKQKKKLNSK